MGKADLHIHTTASDGACSPMEILELAKKNHLDTISLTDHDTIDGYLEAVHHADDYSIRLIPGVEITVTFAGREIHLLAYDFDPADEGLVRFLKQQRKARVSRMEQMLSLLRRDGFDLTMDEVRAESRGSNPGRPHLARIMVRKKMVASVSEAFMRYLGSSLIRKIDSMYGDLDEAVKVVRTAGGVTALAHPGPLYTTEEIESMLEAGIDGLECIHPSHNFEQQRKLSRLAESRHLLVTGGSDFHGTGKAYDPWFGIVTLGSRHVGSLERIARNRKRMNKNTGS